MIKVSERINYLLNYYHLTAGEFADKLGIQKSSVSHLLSGRNKPSFQFLSKLVAAFPEINLNWFVSGDGDILKKSGQIPEYDNLTKLKNETKNNIEPKTTIISPKEKSVSETSSDLNQVKNIIMIFKDDSFKILKKS